MASLSPSSSSSAALASTFTTSAAAPFSTNPFVHLPPQKISECCQKRCCKSTPSVWKFAVHVSSEKANTITVIPTEQSQAVPKKNIGYQVVKITTNTVSLRGISSERLKFEVEYGLKRGTTDNAYVITGADVALIDVPDETFKELFLEALEKTVDLSTLKHVVLGHISPKRVNNLINLLENLNEKGLQVQVHCSNPAAKLLSSSIPESLMGKTLSLRIIKSGDRLELGEGHNLQFILTPTPRWPDGMCTYDPATQLLFTHKLFSAHVCGDNHFDLGGWDVYGEDWQYFYDCMLSPVPRQPTESMLQLCEESGTDLAQFVKREKQKERSKASPRFSVASDVEQAVGRVIGSLCVVSARDGDAESAMLASWVSQASFVPPGLTIAVAKDRAVESLLLPGGKFVLNVLGQGKTAPVMKQLLKPFKPGEPRFEGLDVKDASNGGRILQDAIAWMECTVKSRMETGDHWVVYAAVDNGELQDEKTLSAIHYRKTGARY